MASSGEQTPPVKKVVGSGIKETELGSPKSEEGIKLRIIGSNPEDEFSRDKNALSFS